MSSLGFSRNDLEWWRMPGLWLALLASFAIWSVPREIMADSEASKLNTLNLFQWLTLEIDKWVPLILLPDQQDETDIFQEGKTCCICQTSIQYCFGALQPLMGLERVALIGLRGLHEWRKLESNVQGMKVVLYATGSEFSKAGQNGRIYQMCEIFPEKWPWRLV